MPAAGEGRGRGPSGGPSVHNGGKSGNPGVHQVEIGSYTRSPVRILRHDDRRGASALRHVSDLPAVKVVGREQRGDLPALHQGDDLLHVAGCGWNAWLGLDVFGAGHAETMAEISPLLVVAGDLLASQRLALLEPAAQSVAQGLPLVLLLS